MNTEEAVKVGVDGDAPGRFHLPEPLWLALLLATAGLWLQDRGVFGAGQLVWLLLLDLGAFWLLRHAPPAQRRGLLFWSGIALMVQLAGMLWRMEAFWLLIWAVMLVCMVQVALLVAGHGYAGRDLFVQLAGGVRSMLRLAAGSVSLLRHVELPALRGNPETRGILRGILIALPLIVLFGTLFAQADIRFSQWLSAIPHPLTEAGLLRALRLLVITWLAGGLFTLVTRPLRDTKERRLHIRLGNTETAIVLGSLCVLFALFVSIQVEYLFGGRDAIEQLNTTVAAYARRGFFELLWVAGLTLCVMGSLSLVAGTSRAFRVGTLVLLGLTALILVSALQRLWLYVDSYGLTLQRLSALVALGVIAAGMVLMALHSCGRLQRLLPGLLAAALLLIVPYLLAGPARIVAQVNVQLAQARGNLPDIAYLQQLGEDAVPVVLHSLAGFDAGQRCLIRDTYFANVENARFHDTDWRNANWSQQRARALKAALTQTESPVAWWALLDEDDIRLVRDLRQSCAGAEVLAFRASGPALPWLYLSANGAVVPAWSDTERSHIPLTEEELRQLRRLPFGEVIRLPPDLALKLTGREEELLMQKLDAKQIITLPYLEAIW